MDDIQTAMKNLFHMEGKPKEGRLWEGIAENLFSVSIPIYEYSQFITYLFLSEMLVNSDKSEASLFGNDFKNELM